MLKKFSKWFARQFMAGKVWEERNFDPNAIFVRWEAGECHGIPGLEAIIPDNCVFHATFLSLETWAEKYRRTMTKERWQELREKNIPIFTLRHCFQDAKFYIWLENLQFT